MLRSDLMTIAASLAMAFATFYLIGAIVVDLIGPLISIIVGGPHSDQRRVEVDLAGQEPSVIRG